MQEIGIIHTFKMHKGKKEWQRKNNHKWNVSGELNEASERKMTSEELKKNNTEACRSNSLN